MNMFHFSSGILVLFLFSVTISENSARISSETGNESSITFPEYKGKDFLESNQNGVSSVETSSKDLLNNSNSSIDSIENITVLNGQGSRKGNVGDELSVSVSEGSGYGEQVSDSQGLTIGLNELDLTSGNVKERESVRETIGDGESERVYEQQSPELGQVLDTDAGTTEVFEAIKDERVNENSTENIPRDIKEGFVDLMSYTKSIVVPGTNKTTDNAQLTSSEVQVEDFMTSRVAYHNAILADINEKKDIPLHLYNFQTEDNKTEPLGTPEKLTMEETIGDLWRESAVENKSTQVSTLQNGKADIAINLDNLQLLDKPIADRLTMQNSNQSEESEESFSNQVTEEYFNYETSESKLTTDTTLEETITTGTSEENTLGENSVLSLSHSEPDDSIVVLGNDSLIQVHTNQHLNEDLSSYGSVLKSKSENEKSISSNMELSFDESIGNNPIAEKYYSFGMDKDNKENSLNNKLEDHTETNQKPMTHQSFRDYKDISDEDLVEIQNLLPDHPSFKKEKIEPGVLFEDCTDCDFRVLPIRPSEQRDSPKMEEESLPPSTISFPDLPEGRELQIYSLGLSDGFFLFGYLSEFLSWIQPNEFPVELLRDALRSQITWISLITQSLQVEASFVALLVMGVLLALAVPVVVLSHACYRMTSREDDPADDKVGWAGNCRRRTLVFILQILLVLLLAGMVAMFVTNEQLSDAVVKSSDVIQTSLSDVSAFVHNSHLQIHFLVTQSLDQALQAIYADLDNVDTLLGRPIQRELVRETGIDVALESLADLTREAKETTQQVDRLLDEVRVVQEMVMSTKDKMSDLRQQVELFRRACGPRDRALCDTIDASGLEVTLRLDRLKSDERLHRMRRMGGVGLETAAVEAKERFMSVPSRVEADTRDSREAARRQLMRQRSDVDDRSLALERLVRDMTSKVNEAKYHAGFWMQDIDQFEYWRWIVCMGGGAAVLMVWTLLLCSLCCGCCGSEKAAGPTILVTIVLVCLLSTALWSVALVLMLFGGHGEVFVCRPLYDEPEYHMISRLVDQPGVFYSEARGGFIANVIYGNDTLDVPIKRVLEECRENHGLYPTLGLGRVFDIEAAVDQHRWLSVSMQLRSVKANLSSLEVLSPALQDQLSDLLTTLSVNFTQHRIEMSRPVTVKDMDSFARQLDNIGNQMRDLATASRMETLSTRTRRLVESHIKPLEGRKDSLVYQLTALEVQTGPLQRQVNQSLSHLKTIQFFLNSQGKAIAQRKSRQYVDRLMGYVDQLRRHVVDAVTTSVAPCRPLWDIFNTTRLFLCRHTMDPLNGYWFASMWSLIVLLVATPVCLKLVDYYRARGSRSSGSPSENLMISEQGAGWSSPGYDIKYSKDQFNGNGHFK